MPVLAIYKNGKCVEIHNVRPGHEDKLRERNTYDRIVKIDGRSDIKVGDSWPPGPEPKKEGA